MGQHCSSVVTPVVMLCGLVGGVGRFPSDKLIGFPLTSLVSMIKKSLLIDSFIYLVDPLIRNCPLTVSIGQGHDNSQNQWDYFQASHWEEHYWKVFLFSVQH